ncbi:hypothetical protein D1007_55910 [Hordeum vulgare]|nr:hypothetical protein D1007_55910 [Hordeum vulgare]
MFQQPSVCIRSSGEASRCGSRRQAMAAVRSVPGQDLHLETHSMEGGDPRRGVIRQGSVMERMLIFLSTDQGISTGSMRSVIPEENAAMAEEDRRKRRGFVRREAVEDVLQELVRQRRCRRRWRRRRH